MREILRSSFLRAQTTRRNYPAVSFAAPFQRLLRVFGVLSVIPFRLFSRLQFPLQQTSLRLLQHLRQRIFFSDFPSVFIVPFISLPSASVPSSVHPPPPFPTDISTLPPSSAPVSAPSFPRQPLPQHSLVSSSSRLPFGSLPAAPSPVTGPFIERVHLQENNPATPQPRMTTAVSDESGRGHAI